MRVVIDTNALLVSVSDKSSSYWLFKAIKAGTFEIAFTTEILAEYEEQLSKHWNAFVANTVVTTFLQLPNAIPVTVYYNLNLIKEDFDDNKFADCAFACGAEYIVTEDGDFNVLKSIAFPRLTPIGLTEFKQILINKKLLIP